MSGRGDDRVLTQEWISDALDLARSQEGKGKATEPVDKLTETEREAIFDEFDWFGHSGTVKARAVHPIDADEEPDPDDDDPLCNAKRSTRREWNVSHVSKLNTDRRAICLHCVRAWRTRRDG